MPDQDRCDACANSGVWIGVVNAGDGDGTEIYASRTKLKMLRTVLYYLLAYWPEELPLPLAQELDGSYRLPEDVELLMALLAAWNDFQREQFRDGWAMFCYERLEDE